MSDPLWRGCGVVVVVALVLMEVGYVWEWCVIVDDDGCGEFVEVKGLWLRYGETGLVGRLSGCDEQVLVIRSSQNLASSESSDMGEYCKGKSSLCYVRHINETHQIVNVKTSHPET